MDAANTPAAMPLPQLGAGWQYNAYDLGDGRVLKVPLSEEGRIQIALAQHRNDPAYSKDQAAAWASAVAAGVCRSYQLLEAVLPRLDARLLGNPELMGHGVYEQDKLLMIRDYLLRHSFSENVVVIDRYIETTLQLWQWGISEMVFNFTTNHGIGRDGRVVLCDLGEITADRSIVRRMVSNQLWLQRTSYTTLPDERLKAYVRATLAQHFTSARVEQTWGTLGADAARRG